MLLIMSDLSLYRASSANYTEQDGNDCNHEQGVNDTTRKEATKVANCPNDYKNDGDDIQEGFLYNIGK